MFLKGIREAMTYAYYHKVVKGKSPKNAPTYLPEEEPEKKAASKFVCQVCGYIYEGTNCHRISNVQFVDRDRINL